MTLRNKVAGVVVELRPTFNQVADGSFVTVMPDVASKVETMPTFETRGAIRLGPDAGAASGCAPGDRSLEPPVADVVPPTPMKVGDGIPATFSVFPELVHGTTLAGHRYGTCIGLVVQ